MVSIKNAKKTLKFLIGQRESSIVPGLVGVTGIGKTWIVRQAAEELGYEMVYFNASHLQEGDLALPMRSEQHPDEVVYALHYQLKAIIDQPEKKFLVFFDELNRASIPVVNELMTVVNSSNVHGTQLPATTRFVVAMNPSSDMRGYEDEDYAVNNLDMAHYNRFVLIDVKPYVAPWLDWGRMLNVETGKSFLHPQMLRYFSQSSKQEPEIFYGLESGSVELASPRSWHQVSDLLYAADDEGLSADDEVLRVAVQGLVGLTRATDFITWLIENPAGLDVTDILTNEALSAETVAAFDDLDIVHQQQILEAVIKATDSGESKALQTAQNAINFYQLFDLLGHVDSEQVLFNAMMRSHNFLYRELTKGASQLSDGNFPEIYQRLKKVLVNAL